MKRAIDRPAVEKKQFQYIRRLIIALAISGFTNIVLVSIMLYSFFKELPPTLYCEQKPLSIGQRSNAASLVDKSNADLLRQFRALSADQLTARLSSLKLVENGYMERDLALASLIAFHHFDLPRALLGLTLPTQSRSMAYGQRKDGSILTITLYPQLSEAHFEAITHFAKTERWPYHSEGLFLFLKMNREHPEPSLVDAFVLTPEFLSIETLLNRSQIEIGKMHIVNLLLDGEWQELKDFTQPQGLADLSAERRQKLLEIYIKRGSATAADILLRTDFAFALRKLDNEQIIQILQLLVEKSDHAEAFAKALLNSPRNDAIWNLASERLGQYGVLAMHPLPHHTPAIKHIERKALADVTPFPSKNRAKQIPLPHPIPKKDHLYIIQEGDNLWKLSRRFGVSIELLRGHNQLKNEVLKPGSPLRIPVQ